MFMYFNKCSMSYRSEYWIKYLSNIMPRFMDRCMRFLQQINCDISLTLEVILGVCRKASNEVVLTNTDTSNKNSNDLLKSTFENKI